MLEADDDVRLGVRIRQVRELQVVVVEVQRRRVRESDHRQRFARPRLDGRIGGRIHLRSPEALAHVLLRDDDRAGLAEGIVATGVIAMQVRVDHEMHRLVREHRDGGADLRRHVGELIVDDGGAVDAHREPHVATAPHEHVDARAQWSMVSIFTSAGAGMAGGGVCGAAGCCAPAPMAMASATATNPIAILVFFIAVLLPELLVQSRA